MYLIILEVLVTTKSSFYVKLCGKREPREDAEAEWCGSADSPIQPIIDYPLSVTYLAFFSVWLRQYVRFSFPPLSATLSRHSIPRPSSPDRIFLISYHLIMVHLHSVEGDEAADASPIPGLEPIKRDQYSDDDASCTIYGSRFAAEELPRHEMPEREMPKEVAYRLIKDDLTLDGNPVLNLASFVTTYMVHLNELSPSIRRDH